jgi:hypothetical protein
MSTSVKRLGRGRAYSVTKFATQQKSETDKETQIYDPRFKFDVLTLEYIKRFKLQPQVIPVLNIPLAYNENRGCFEIISAPSVIDARIKGYYYGSVLPSITTPDFYAVGIDRYARIMTNLYGKDVVLSWVHGSEITAPAANTALVSKTVSTGAKGYIYGFFVSVPEPNDIKINFTYNNTNYSIRIPFSAKGAIHFADIIPINEGMPADGGSTITITNVNAGSVGLIYQARLLYAEG